MGLFKSHFALTTSQRNGIFILVIIVILLQLFLIFGDAIFYSQVEEHEDPQILEYQNQLRAAQHITETENDTIYPFNPNFITDYKGYQLGMNMEEIDRLLKYRDQNKWVNSSEEFQQITGISDSLLKKISPAFRFPAWTQNNAKSINQEKKLQTIAVTTDLNAASAEDLMRVNGVGEVLSKRIVSYRYKIGGFRSAIQLYDVYGLSPEVVQRIQQKFEIHSKPDYEILDLNTIELSDLSNLPYFNPDLAKKVITYRKLHERINSFEELSKIEAFPSDKIDRIKLYLAIH